MSVALRGLLAPLVMTVRTVAGGCVACLAPMVLTARSDLLVRLVPRVLLVRRDRRGSRVLLVRRAT